MRILHSLANLLNHTSLFPPRNQTADHTKRIQGWLEPIDFEERSLASLKSYHSNTQINNTNLFNQIFNEESSWSTCRMNVRDYLNQGNSFVRLYRKIQEDLSSANEEGLANKRKLLQRGYLILDEIDQCITKGSPTVSQLIGGIFARIFLQPSHWSTINCLFAFEQGNSELIDDVNPEAENLGQETSSVSEMREQLQEQPQESSSEEIGLPQDKPIQEMRSEETSSKEILDEQKKNELQEVVQLKRGLLQSALKNIEAIKKYEENVDTQTGFKVYSLIEIAELQQQFRDLDLARDTLEMAFAEAYKYEYKQHKVNYLLAVAYGWLKIDSEKAQRIIDKATEVAKKIDSKFFISRALIKVVTTQVLIDPKKAIEIVNEIEEEGDEENDYKIEALTEMAVVQAQRGYLRKAITTVNLINEYDKEKILKGRKKEEALKKVAIEWAKIDLKKAMKLVEEIQDQHIKAEVLVAIAALQIQDRPKKASEILQQAIEAANKIGIDHLESMVLEEIEKLQLRMTPKKSLKKLQEKFEKAEEKNKNIDFCNIAKEQVEIAKLQMRTNPKEALDTLNQALETAFEAQKEDKEDSLFEIVEALIKVVEIQMRTNPKEAQDTLKQVKVIADKIKSPGSKAAALINIAVTWSQMDLTQSLKIVKQIKGVFYGEEESYQASARVKIAIALAKTDVNQAIKVAKKIVDKRYQTEALIGIVRRL